MGEKLRLFPDSSNDLYERFDADRKEV